MEIGAEKQGYIEISQWIVQSAMWEFRARRYCWRWNSAPVICL